MKARKIFNVSNTLSLSRVALAVPIFILLDHMDESLQMRLLTIAVMMAAAFTDMLDGYFARKLNEITDIGKVIDPFADKLAVGIIIVKLYLIGAVPEFFFWVIISRDVLIFGGGIVIKQLTGKVLASNYLGKGTVMVIGLFLLLVIGGLDKASALYGLVMYTSVALSFASVIVYFRNGITTILKHTGEVKKA